ncbi:E3 ubiquitin-protein ligase BRE1A-like [Haemorhous mexicanus]|uniref:E3 ubiquitin-protein ligase BRE1A-like n=1 Tax=Haemorhous mexicanus TaxID=30427 RepID=UPI0028BF0C18|nr:E3 ubiquitin-protein ligase BRE1A-like [Haemorhous mexicanus]
MTDDLQWDIDKIRKREQRLSRHLADVLERVNSKGYKVYGAGSILCGGTITISACKEEGASGRSWNCCPSRVGARARGSLS